MPYGRWQDDGDSKLPTPYIVCSHERELVAQYVNFVAETDSPLAELAKTYLCPITQEAYRDPVCASDGHTYERAHFETHTLKQVREGLLRTSPLTNKPLAWGTLYDNHQIVAAMRALVESELGLADEPMLDEIERRLGLDPVLSYQRVAPEPPAPVPAPVCVCGTPVQPTVSTEYNRAPIVNLAPLRREGYYDDPSDYEAALHIWYDRHRRGEVGPGLPTFRDVIYIVRTDRLSAEAAGVSMASPMPSPMTYSAEAARRQAQYAHVHTDTPDAPDTPDTPDSPDAPDAPNTPDAIDAPNPPDAPGAPLANRTNRNPRASEERWVGSTNNFAFERDVYNIASQTGATRDAVVEALRRNDGDYVNAILELTS
jgi:NACalpha-BTF3-like transcription factor